MSRVTYDPNKRAACLQARGLDFEDAPKVFAGKHFDRIDDRKDYGEVRFITFGWLADDMVVIVWTPRDDTWRIISMRYANDREQEEHRHHL